MVTIAPAKEENEDEEIEENDESAAFVREFFLLWQVYYKNIETGVQGRCLHYRRRQLWALSSGGFWSLYVKRSL